MTKEEKLAEEYSKDHHTLTCCDCNYYDSQEDIQEAFLAGLKAGRQEKWHKVADGDYPPCEIDNCSINVLTESGDIAYYNYDDESWIVEPSSVEIDPPKAWCYIPQFDKK